MGFLFSGTSQNDIHLCLVLAEKGTLIILTRVSSYRKVNAKNMIARVFNLDFYQHFSIVLRNLGPCIICKAILIQGGPINMKRHISHNIWMQ